MMTTTTASVLQRLRAADDLHQLLRDRRLPRAVVSERQPPDHLLRVPRRRVHRGHLRAEEARLALEERAKEGDLDVHRHEALEERAAVRLVEKLRRGDRAARLVLFFRRGGEGQERLE